MDELDAPESSARALRNIFGFEKDNIKRPLQRLKIIRAKGLHSIREYECK
jgi:hypothetical protein